TNTGTSWLDLAGASTSAARLLNNGAGNRIRFVPAAGFSGSAGFTFRAWDGTSGVNGGTADASITGGTTAFSTASANASIDVVPVTTGGGTSASFNGFNTTAS